MERERIKGKKLKENEEKNKNLISKWKSDIFNK